MAWESFVFFFGWGGGGGVHFAMKMITQVDQQAKSFSFDESWP